MSNINKTTHENYPVKIHPIYNLKNFMKIVDKHITPEDLKKPVHPVYNLKNFMKIVDKVLEKEKQKSIIKNNNTFKEGDHPRDSEGKFTDKGTGETTDGKDSTYKSTDDFRRVQEESRGELDKPIRERTSTSNNEKLRARLSADLRRELERRGYNSSNSNELLLKSDKGVEFKLYKNVDSETFHDFFEISKSYTKNGELVDLHSLEDYKNTTNYLSDDGLSGFSITPEGDLISVFNADTSKKGFLSAIAPIIKEKVKTLDCYNSQNQLLAEMYSRKFGFKVASIMDYNMEYDHDDIALNHNNPQVAFMVNVESEIETKHFNKDQYDDAVEYQKQCLESVKAKQQNADDWITVKGNHIKLKEGESKEQAVDRFIKEKEKSESETTSDEIKRKIESVKIDFSKDNILPELNKEDLEELGKKSKPVLVSKRMLDRNKIFHPEIDDKDYSILLGTGLYNNQYIFKSNPEKPNYYHFIGKIPNDKYNSGLIIELADNKDTFEVVHITKLRDKSVRRIKERDGN